MIGGVHGGKVQQMTDNQDTNPSPTRVGLWVASKFALFTMASAAVGLVVLITIAGIYGSVVLAIALAVAALAFFAIALTLARHEPGRPRSWGLTRPHRSGEPWRIAVLAAQDSVGSELARELELRRERNPELFVIGPAVDKGAEHWLGAGDAERKDAQGRLDSILVDLHERGFEAGGQVGPNDPLQALEDALAEYGADEVILASHADDELGHYERDLAERIRARCRLPLTHVLPRAKRDTTRI